MNVPAQLPATVEYDVPIILPRGGTIIGVNLHRLTGTDAAGSAIASPSNVASFTVILM